MSETKFLTNKLPYDLEFTKELKNIQYNEENKCYTVKKENEEFCLKKTDVIFFLKTFYLKESLLYIGSILLSFFLGKIFVLSALITILLYGLVYTDEDKAQKIHNKFNKYFIILTGGIGFIIATLVLISFFVTISFTYISFLFYILYLSFTMNFILGFYFKYKDRLFLIEQDNQIVKGYIAWKKN